MPLFINIIVSVLAFGLTALSGFYFIPFLRKVKAGQTILDIGPKWHKSKEGTPTMGGFMFIVGITISVIVGYAMLTSSSELSADARKNGLRLVVGFVMALLFSLVGFVDDYIKVVKKRNLGLNAKQKLVFQFLISAVYLIVLYYLNDKSTVIPLPFAGDVDFKFFYFPVMILFIVFMVNSVNLNDGIDGLCGSVTLVTALAFATIFIYLENSDYAIFSFALAGGCLGFLLWNLNPARVFMGDTGSMFLGGAVVALSFATGHPLIIILVGIIYVIESLSVILQVISFKTTGKRIFKMSPIHHHFEMSGWSEYKIVVVFSIITLVAGSLSALYIIKSVSEIR